MPYFTQIRTGMVSVSSDGKPNGEPMRLQLTMELLVLQRIDTSTPTASMGPPAESKVNKMNDMHVNTQQEMNVFLGRIITGAYGASQTQQRRRYGIEHKRRC